MSISKNFGHLLSDRSKNGAGFSIVIPNGVKQVLSASDLAPGSKGQGTLTINETAGGGPFHVVYEQNGKVLSDQTIVGGSIAVSYTVNEKIGAKPNLTDGDVTFTITGQKHDAHIFNNFDAAK